MTIAERVFRWLKVQPQTPLADLIAALNRRLPALDGPQLPYLGALTDDPLVGTVARGSLWYNATLDQYRFFNGTANGPL